jgi:hypothetical protein
MHLRFRLPPSAILPVFIAVGAALACYFLFDALRYVTCAPWTRLPASPSPAAQLLAAMPRTIYVNDSSGRVYCFEHGTWSRCTYPSFNTLSKDQPEWVKPYLTPKEIQEPVVDLHRNDNIVAIDYYALTQSGAVFQCSTNFQDETNRIFRSSSGLILLVLAIIALVALVTFLRIATTEGQPRYRDLDGIDRDY